MKVDAEDYKRPEHNCGQAFNDVPRDVPGHQVSVATGDHEPDHQIHDPYETLSSSAHRITTYSTHHHCPRKRGIAKAWLRRATGEGSMSFAFSRIVGWPTGTAPRILSGNCFAAGTPYLT